MFIDILRTKGSFPNARCFGGNGPKPITVWCSNDYLCMGQHPAVVEAMETALHEVGAGSGGTRNISGNTHYHTELEAELAESSWQGRRAAVHQRLRVERGRAVDAGKMLPGCIIFSDELNHASMIAGIKNSGCENACSGTTTSSISRSCWLRRNRKHPNWSRSRASIRWTATSPRSPPFAISPTSTTRSPTSTKSMPLACTATRRRNFRTRWGRSPADDHRRDARQGVRRDGRLYRGRPHHHRLHPQLCAGLHFHHHLSPVLVAGALASVRHLKASDDERRGAAGIRRDAEGEVRRGGAAGDAELTHIVPLLVGCPIKAKKISDILLAEYGIYVQPINYPTVPRGTERLRFTPGPQHNPR